jgi:uncharacterized protein with HEPN domain
MPRPGIMSRITVAGHYDRIDPEIIWNTVENDLGPLQMAVHAALNRLDDGPKPG